MPAEEWVTLVAQRDQAAALLALVGMALALIVCATPRRWRAWVLGAMAAYAILASVMAAV
jgi:hypothetical protein